MTDDGEYIGLIALVIGASIGIQYGSAFVLDTSVPWYAACTVMTVFIMSDARINAIQYKRRSERLHEDSTLKRKELEVEVEQLREELNNLKHEFLRR